MFLCRLVHLSMHLPLCVGYSQAICIVSAVSKLPMGPRRAQARGSLILGAGNPNANTKTKVTTRKKLERAFSAYLTRHLCALSIRAMAAWWLTTVNLVDLHELKTRGYDGVFKVVTAQRSTAP